MASTVTRSQFSRVPLGCGGWNLQQLRDAIMSIWTKIFEECFQHLVESMPRRIKAVLKTKGVQPGTSKVYLIKWPVSVYKIFTSAVVIITIQMSKNLKMSYSLSIDLFHYDFTAVGCFCLNSHIFRDQIN